MLKLRAGCVLILALSLSDAAWAASSKPTSQPRAIPGHVSELDGPVTTLSASDGRTWAAWSYRARGEFDIAVSFADANTATWSQPMFLGGRNGTDEIDPAIAVDSNGVVYVAFETKNPSRVSVAVLSPHMTSWSEPLVVSGAEDASSPALTLLGNRPVVAYKTGHGVRIALPIYDGENELYLGDGPDPVGPNQIKDKRIPPVDVPTSGN
jgi:hypothetical protein